MIIGISGNINSGKDTVASILVYLYAVGKHKATFRDWVIKKDAYYDGLKRLIAKGYLVPINQKETIYVFVQRPSKHDKSEFAKID